MSLKSEALRISSLNKVYQDKFFESSNLAKGLSDNSCYSCIFAKSLHLALSAMVLAILLYWCCRSRHIWMLLRWHSVIFMSGTLIIVIFPGNTTAAVFLRIPCWAKKTSHWKINGSYLFLTFFLQNFTNVEIIENHLLCAKTTLQEKVTKNINGEYFFLPFCIHKILSWWLLVLSVYAEAD